MTSILAIYTCIMAVSANPTLSIVDLTDIKFDTICVQMPATVKLFITEEDETPALSVRQLNHKNIDVNYKVENNTLVFYSNNNNLDNQPDVEIRVLIPHDSIDITTISKYNIFYKK